MSSQDNKLQTLNRSDYSVTNELSVDQSEIKCVLFLKDRLFVGCQNQCLYTFDLTTFKATHNRAKLAQVPHLLLALNDNFVLCAQQNAHIEIFAVKNWENVQKHSLANGDNILDMAILNTKIETAIATPFGVVILEFVENKMRTVFSPKYFSIKDTNESYLSKMVVTAVKKINDT